MTQLFAFDFVGNTFVLFGLEHVLSLVFIAGAALATAMLRGTSTGIKRRIRLTIGVLIWIDEAAWHVWNLYWGSWDIAYMLPLNMCSLMIWLTGFILIAKNRTLYPFTYFLGIGACTQYLITPDLGIYGFPHFRFLQAFISHGLVVVAAVYMTTVEGFRPTWRSMLKVALWGNVYAVAVFFVNSAIGSNYLMINAKPGTPSLLDLLPPWPYYLIFMEAIGIVTFLLLYVPFALKDRRRAAGTPA